MLMSAYFCLLDLTSRVFMGAATFEQAALFQGPLQKAAPPLPQKLLKPL